MHALHPQRAAWTVGLQRGGFHSIWALRVAIGLAQPLSNWRFRLHCIFIRPVYGIVPFQLGLALTQRPALGAEIPCGGLTLGLSPAADT
ncbi:MAG: hypothetical protein ACK5QW_10685 [Cyanobacteriota bacterium]